MIAVFVFFFLLVIGTPIALVVLFTSMVGTLTYTTTAPNVVIAQMFAGMDTTTLLAVPFFIVAGMIASKGKTSEKLVQVMNLIFGRLPGGPVIATIFTCAFFAAISGSGPATVAAMEEYATGQGYGLDFSQGRFHHEIYLSDVRRCKPEKWKTVIRQPIIRAE